MKEAEKNTSFSKSLSPTPNRSPHNSAYTTSIENGELVDQARQLMRVRAELATYIPQGLIKDWAWDMLLELFVSTEEGTLVYVKQLILASGASPPAAMRLIDRLEEAELIRRLADPLDSRRVIVTLSERGREAMLTLLRSLFG